MKNTGPNHKMPTLEEIRLYHEGSLDATRVEAIEAEAAENPLVADALEGYAAIPAFAAVPGVDLFEGSLSKTAAGSTAAAGGKTLFSWFSLNVLMVTAGISVAAVTGIVLSNADQQQPHPVQQDPVISQDMAVYSPRSDASNLVVEDYAPTGEELPAETKDAPITSQPTDVAVTTVEASLPVRAPAAMLEFHEAAVAETAPSGVPAETRVGIAAADIQHILNYKVVDYSNMRSDNWTSFSGELGGVSAQFESEEQQKAHTTEDAGRTAIPYMEYLEQCIIAIDNGQYALAIRKFEIISAQYPDDINACFYTAHAFFESGEYEKAIGLFEQTMKNPVRTFNEDAEFYKAKSLKELGKMDEAHSLFIKILQKGRHYSARAARELD